MSEPPRPAGGLGSQLLGPSSSEGRKAPERRREGDARVSDLLLASGPSARFATPLPPPLEFGLDDAMQRRQLDGSRAGRRTALAGLIWALAIVVAASRLLYEAGGLELFFPSPSEPAPVPRDYTSLALPLERPSPRPLTPEPLAPAEPSAPAEPVVQSTPAVAGPSEPAPTPSAIAPAPMAAVPAMPTLEEWLAAAEAPRAVDPGFYFDETENVIVIGDRVSRDTLDQYMRITVSADADAILAVDGAVVGRAPLPDVLMAAGPHFFQARRDDGSLVEQLVEVDARTGRVDF